MVTASILAGNTGGRLWSLDPDDPARLSLLWDQGNNVFIPCGQDRSEEAATALSDTVSDQIREGALEDRAAYFCVRALDAACEPLVDLAFGPYLQSRREKSFHLFPGSTMAVDWPVGVEGVSWHPIDKAFLQRNGLQNSRPILGEIEWMWPSADRYFHNGWGCAAMVGDMAICWCTAEYVGPGLCGTGISTVSGMQGKGAATAAAARFVAESLARGCTPHWECDVDNRPSVRVAEKLGFVCVERFALLVGRFR